jgi:PTS system mannose-specific IIB component/fructoselysine and glucoselysine-specific PTS system IIB component
MPILLCRVDDRLIHGQVVVGWAAQLGLDFIAVIDDELAVSEWEQDLYRAGLSESIEARFVTLDQAAAALPGWRVQEPRAFLITRDIATMRRLAERGALSGIEVNLGGLHDAPGRRRVLPYLFLNEDDRAELRRLRAAGVSVTAQDVPSARRVPLGEILELRSN